MTAAPVSGTSPKAHLRASTLPKKHSSIGMNYQSLELKGARGLASGAMENSDGASIFAGEFNTPVVFKE